MSERGTQSEGDYGLSSVETVREIAAPELPYRPPRPRRPADHRIGLIGCGGIAGHHLAAYADVGYVVAALCDRDEARARALRDSFYPDAVVVSDHRQLLACDDLSVVDLATHAVDRVPLIEQSLLAGKHVLSQKPYVLDLDSGERLADLADESGLRLAINQNGRWAPHFSYLREAVAAGLIGEVESLLFTLHWDHRWTIGTPFEEMDDLILYDFAIHWFDLAALFLAGREAGRVTATAIRSRAQQARTPFLAQATIEFDGALASLFFNGDVVHGQEDRTVIAGSRGTAISHGPSLSKQSVTIHTADGVARPKLDGTWFREGFQGTMGELLCAIEEGRRPLNDARDNLRGLALCFAALDASRSGEPRIPGRVRRRI